MKRPSVVDLCLLPACVSCKAQLFTRLTMVTPTSHQKNLPSSPVSQSRHALVFIAFVLCLLLLVPCTNAASTRQGCHKVGVRHVINEPDCEPVAVDVYKCTGRCLSFSFPSSDSVLEKNPEQTLTVRAKCCRMIETKMITVDLSCSDGQRSVEIPSAKECGCFDCGALI